MEYTFKWMNQSGIAESGMDKWIVTLRDDQGNLLKKIENSDATNLQNFSEVIIKMNLTYDEAMRQTASNTSRIFFDSESTDTQLIEMNVLFDRTRVPVKIEDITTIVREVPQFIMPIGAKFKCSSNDPLGSNNTYTYEHMGDNKIKNVPDETSSSMNCRLFNYTGRLNQRTFSARCGPGFGRCSGTQCCSEWGWCHGSVGKMDDYWCIKSRRISDTYAKWDGIDVFNSGNDIENMNIIRSSSPNPVTTSPRCGAGYGRCPGTQCCSRWGWCGGNRGAYSGNCTGYENNVGYVGYNSEYDGNNTTNSGAVTFNTVPIKSEPIVFKCASYDPLHRNNETIYKWSDSSLKSIPSVPSGYTVYTVPSCDGIEYGGPG